MYKISSRLMALAIIFFAASVTQAADSGFHQSMELEARELHVQFYPSDKLIRIREYGLSTLLTDAAEIEEQATQLQDLVTNADYCETRFGIPGFAAGQEVLFATGTSDAGGAYNEAAAHIECMLVTASDMPDSMRAAFSSLLGRDVTVTGTEQEITLEFSTPDLAVGPNNAIQNLINRGTAQGRLVWKNGERFYEAVFINASKPPEAFRSLYSYIPAFPISSPVLDQKKVEALRERLKQDP